MGRLEPWRKHSPDSNDQGRGRERNQDICWTLGRFSNYTKHVYRFVWCGHSSSSMELKIDIHLWVYFSFIYSEAAPRLSLVLSSPCCCWLTTRAATQPTSSFPQYIYHCSARRLKYISAPPRSSPGGIQHVWKVYVATVIPVGLPHRTVVVE